jgi:uncharacterized protein YgbK (DUF1537 family)
LVARLVVLDDDPTGVQTLAGIRVLLDWRAGRIAGALAGRRSVHVITNSRALSREQAHVVVGAAARAAIDDVEDARLVLRGDSTLRGHVWEEYEAVCAATESGRPPLLLAPALPSAGRVTRGGVHLIERDGVATPLHETEYARDGVFSYRSARLLEWAEERSKGVLRADTGRELHLDELRASGARAVADGLADLAASGRPCVLAVDAETDGDLALVSEGYADALAAGVGGVLRCAPALAGILAGTTATALAAPPQGEGGVLVVCGSYVPISTQQLAVLTARRPGTLVEVDVAMLASTDADREVGRAAAAASELMRRTGLAILATPRERPAGTTDVESGRRIAEGLARAAGAVLPRPRVVIAKGGITAAVTLRTGFGFEEAEVIGPVVSGISRWRAGDDASGLDYLVVPGNVGHDEVLAELVDLIAAPIAVER